MLIGDICIMFFLCSNKSKKERIIENKHQGYEENKSKR